MNVIAWVDLEHPYSDIAVQLVTHYTKGTPPLSDNEQMQ